MRWIWCIASIYCAMNCLGQLNWCRMFTTNSTTSTHRQISGVPHRIFFNILCGFRGRQWSRMFKPLPPSTYSDSSPEFLTRHSLTGVVVSEVSSEAGCSELIPPHSDRLGAAHIGWFLNIFVFAVLLDEGRHFKSKFICTQICTQNLGITELQFSLKHFRQMLAHKALLALWALETAENCVWNKHSTCYFRMRLALDIECFWTFCIGCFHISISDVLGI